MTLLTHCCNCRKDIILPLSDQTTEAEAEHIAKNAVCDACTPKAVPSPSAEPTTPAAKRGAAAGIVADGREAGEGRA